MGCNTRKYFLIPKEPCVTISMSYVSKLNLGLGTMKEEEFRGFTEDRKPLFSLVLGLGH